MERCWLLEAERPDFEELEQMLLTALVELRIEAREAEHHAGPTAGAGPQRECCICQEMLAMSEGISCNATDGHFTCMECLHASVQRWLGSVPERQKQLARNNGDLPCSGVGCPRV
eukprot:jgi/Tetstr1/459827/TSEL_005176.t1